MLRNSFFWHDSLCNENINQTLQRLHILSRQEIVVHRHSGKMYEAAVELQMSVDMPERIVPVTVVQMSITPEHLFDDAFHISVEMWRKARSFAYPVTATSQLTH